jgi:TolB-like protein/Flp pilus assembly protein TadD
MAELERAQEPWAGSARTAMSFWTSLKERKLVQWALAYLACAWVFLQAITLLGATYGWPVGLMRAVPILLAVGFLAALVLAWYHGERGRQRVSGPELLMLAGIFILAGAAVTWVSRGAERRGAADGQVTAAPAPSAGEQGSIGVLPFTSMSADEETDPFVHGIHDDIITHLARIASLRVISRTSVQEYRSTTKNVRQIGQELGVSALLAGSVQRAGDRLRINVQLIDARTDTHLWAQTFDRQFTLENLFAMQSEIAEQVASALRATLAPGERERLAARPTTSLAAYEFYVRAREHWGHSQDASDRQLILRMLEEAVRLDPGFAAAYARMGLAHAAIWWNREDPVPERLRLARAAIDRAFELDPELPEARLALGHYYYWGYLDYDRALAELERAAAVLPSDATVAGGIGAVHRRRGDMERAVLHQRRAAELDPRSATTAISLAQTYDLMRAFQEAERGYDRAIALAPTWGAPYALKASLLFRATGDPEQATAVLAQSRRLGLADHPEVIRVGVTVELAAGRTGAARAWLERFGDQAYATQFSYVLPEQSRARIHEVEGDAAAARAAHEAAWRRLERLLSERPDDPRLHAAFGIARAGMGHFDEAGRAGRHAVELLPVEREAWRGVVLLEDLAEIHTRAGQHDAAIEIIERLLRLPGQVTEPALRVDPRWAPLRDQPRFEQLIARGNRVR